MSSILKILVPTVPPRNPDAYAFADALVPLAADLPPAPRLVRLHDALVERYPCWSSGAYASSGRAQCPWADTPLITCFRGDMGIIGITGANPDVVPFVLRRAGALALTVIDQQAGKVYRPATFSVVFRGVQKNVNTRAMVAKLEPLLKMGSEQVLRTLSTPNVMLKCRLDYVVAQRFVATMDLIGCNCTVEKEILVSTEGVATVMGFPAEATELAPAPVKPVPQMMPAWPAPVKVAGPVKETEAVKVAEPVKVAVPVKVAEPAQVTEMDNVVERIKAAVAVTRPVPESAPVAGAVKPIQALAGGEVPKPEEPQQLPQQLPQRPTSPVAPVAVATAPMARFAIDEPDAKPRRGLDLSLAPAWLARIFGKAGA